MAEGDRLVGSVDTFSGEVVPSITTLPSDVFLLYHCYPSFFSQIARLALNEAGVSWRSRTVDIHGALEQYERWYLSISPTATVPVLCSASAPPLVDSRDILRFACNTAGSLLPSLADEGREGASAADKRVSDLIDRVYSFPVEPLTLSFVYSRLPRFVSPHPAMCRNGIARMRRLQEESVDEEFKRLLESKVQQNQARLRMLERADEAYEEAFAAVGDFLAALERALGDVPSGKFLGQGGEYCAADVACTVLLARLNALPPAALRFKKYARVCEYWESVQGRSSFARSRVMYKFPFTMRALYSVWSRRHMLAIIAIAILALCMFNLT